MKHTDYIDPLIGSGETELHIKDALCKTWFFLKAQCGNTHPGACIPFGMVSACAYSGGYPTGYGTHAPNTHGRPAHFLDSLRVSGFTHFQQSGTGGIERYYNFVRVIPMTLAEHDPSVMVQTEHETARAGYYALSLPEKGVLAELSVTAGAAAHRYTFQHGGKLAIDFAQSGLCRAFGPKFYKNIQSLTIHILSAHDTAAVLRTDDIPIYVHTHCPGSKTPPLLWKGDLHTVRPAAMHCQNDCGEAQGVVFDHIPETCELYVGFSLTGAEHAKANALAAARIGFDKIAVFADAEWEDKLSRAHIECSDEALRRTYYTALYHSLIKPAEFGADGGKLGSYLDFATLWDMYKTQFPLVASLYGREASAITDALLRMGEEFGGIPNALLLANDTNLFRYQARMLGVYMVMDAYHRAVSNVDWNRAFDVCLKELSRPEAEDFITGRLPERYTHMLDSADACRALASLADDLDKKRELQTLLTLSKRWREVYNENTGLLRENSEYYEGTLYNYSFRLLADMPGRIALAGGNDRFVKMLDAFFGYGAPAVSQPVDPADKSYMAYGHMLHRFEGYNNEPDMEAPYAYLYAGRHDRTCEVVRFGMRSMYHDGRGGLPGNDDSGGLSSCFVWNTLGLFPVSGQALVLLGSPSIDAADLLLHNGQTLSVRVHGQSEENIYVKKIIRNGKRLDRAWLSTDEFMSGGTLEFYMTADAACDRFPPVTLPSTK